MESARRLRLIWFLFGTAAGGGVTAAVLLLLVLPGLPAGPPAGEAPAPEEVAAAAESPCPGLSQVTPPWLPAGDSDLASVERLAVPPSLSKRVAFWKDLWGKQPNRVYLFIDRRRPWVVHTSVSCRDLFPPGVATAKKERQCDQRLITAKRKLKRRLKKERRRKSLRRLFGNDRRLARTAYRNVMLLEGRRDSFAQALERGNRFMADVERVFHALELVPSLARVAVIESLADPDAVSPAGAVGAYQFVAGTAREYLMVENGVDERLDPVREGWAAAQYLKKLHRRFKSWPLALTAYNTGPTRLRKLIKRRRTRDIGKLADRGTSGGFGFDGQNYYAQLAAVVELTSEHGPLKANGRREVYRLDKSMPLAELSKCLTTPADRLIEANPALSEDIRRGGAHVPEGYLLAMPGGGELPKTASQP